MAWFFNLFVWKWKITMIIFIKRYGGDSKLFLPGPKNCWEETKKLHFWSIIGRVEFSLDLKQLSTAMKYVILVRNNYIFLLSCYRDMIYYMTFAFSLFFTKKKLQWLFKKQYKIFLYYYVETCSNGKMNLLCSLIVWSADKACFSAECRTIYFYRDRFFFLCCVHFYGIAVLRLVGVFLWNFDLFSITKLPIFVLFLCRKKYFYYYW